MRSHAHLVLVLMLLVGALPLAAVEPVTFFVAPDGDDAAAGTVEKPFRTPARARDAVRQVRRDRGGKLGAPATVFLRGGNYFLPEKFMLTPEDGGTAEHPVIYAAHGDEKPVLSGGRLVSGWEKRELRGTQVWSAKVAPPAEGVPFRSVWVNGERRVRARHPDKRKGFLKVAEVPAVTPQTQWQEGQKGFRYAEGDLSATLPAGAEVMLTSRWVESRLPVERVDAAQRLLHFTRKSVFITEPGDRYWVEGAAELMTEAGEWHYDAATSTLHYLAKPGEDVSRAEVIVPALTQVLRLEGAKDRSVEYVHFRGIRFSHTEWNHDWPGADKSRSGFSQAATGVSNAVEASGTRHCSFDRCEFAHLGTYALQLSTGAQNNRVTACTFTDLGAGGVRIGETVQRPDPAEQSFGNVVEDCRITDGGHLFPSAVGVWIGQSYDNTIAHNEIANFYYTGISVGWTWGYDTSLAKGNVVERNHVHHIGQPAGELEPILSDMAGIYTLGVQPGTVIRHNRFHDIAAIKYGGWGIYFDEGSSNIVAENNVVYRTTHGGFHQHYGRDNVFRNNVIAFGRDVQVQRTRSEAHRSFTFERNIVYWAAGEPITGNWDNCNVAFDHNVYWRTDGKTDFRFAGMSLEQWRQKGMDVHSVMADPRLANPEAGDFTLRPGSPAAGVGFVSIDPGGVGPRQGSGRGQ